MSIVYDVKRAVLRVGTGELVTLVMSEAGYQQLLEELCDMQYTQGNPVQPVKMNELMGCRVFLQDQPELFRICPR